MSPIIRALLIALATTLLGVLTGVGITGSASTTPATPAPVATGEVRQIAREVAEQVVADRDKSLNETLRRMDDTLKRIDDTLQAVNKQSNNHEARIQVLEVTQPARARASARQP